MEDSTESYLREQVGRLNEEVRRLSARVGSLEVEVQNHEYYKADKEHNHPEYERRQG